MDRKDVRRYQLSQLALLKKFDEITKKLNLDYYLIFGTLLGAIRHNGFIPWDADIDVAMHRNQYEMLCKYFLEQPEKGLFYEHYDTEKNHISPHAILKIKGTKVVYNAERSSRYPVKHNGIYIDIFPIDKVNSNKILQYKEIKKIYYLRRIISLKQAPTYGEKTSLVKKIAKKMVSVLLSCIPFLKLNQLIDKAMKKYDNLENSDMIAILTEPSAFERLLFPKEFFGKAKYISFENIELPIPSYPEKVLSIIYGDYMQLPQENQRWQYLDIVVDHIDYGENTFVSKEIV